MGNDGRGESDRIESAKLLRPEMDHQLGKRMPDKIGEKDLDKPVNFVKAERRTLRQGRRVAEQRFEDT